MDRRAALILERAKEMHSGSSLSGRAWNISASAKAEAAGEHTRSLTSQQRAHFLKTAESQLLREGIITQVDQS